MEKSEKLPPIFADYEDIHIHLDIQSSGRNYEMHLRCEEANFNKKFIIDMTLDDLYKLNRRLCSAFRSLVFNDIHDEDCTRRLVTEGYNAFLQIFSSKEVKELFLRLLSLFKTALIEITTQDFFLPWELIYVGRPQEEISIDKFLGSKHIISRFMGSGDIPISPYINHAKPIVGLATNTKLEYVSRNEIPFFETMNNRSEISLIRLNVLDAANRQSGMRDFEIFLTGNKLDFAHFACHAVEVEAEHESSYMLLSNEFDITLRDLRMLDDLQLNDNPVVILNACNTGVIDSKYASSFAKFFHKYGARGVIATDCQIPDKFAAQFTERFYSIFIQGNTLGDTLFRTRRHFIEKFEDLTVLIYSLYATPVIRLARQQITVWQGDDYG